MSGFLYKKTAHFMDGVDKIMNKVKSSKKKKLSAMELSLLCHQLALVFQSGANPVEGIPLLADDITQPELKASLKGISERIIEGMTMYQAFSLDESFPDYMLHMIKIGEMTGMLDIVMENLSEYYESEAEINKRIKNAVAYPAALAILMLGVIFLMIIKIIPMFGEIVTSLGGQMPKEAEYLFLFTVSLQKILFWLAVIAIPIILILIVFFKTQKGKLIFDRIKVHNPISGPIYKKIIASRFGLGLSLTTKSGMHLTDGFNTVKGLMRNGYVASKLKEASLEISEGESLSDAVKNTGIFPELFVKMLRTGERSGNLDSMIEKISKVYGKEAELSIQGFSRIIEPALVSFLSIILAIILLSVLLPLIGMMSSIG